MATKSPSLHSAAQSAIDYANAVLIPLPEEIAVEEIERSDDGSYWMVTIGYWRPKPKSALDQELEKQRKGGGLVIRIPSTEVQRVYKVVKIDATNGNAISMKNRDV